MHKPAHTPRQTPRHPLVHQPTSPPLSHLGQASTLAALDPLGTFAEPHTEWRMPSGHPQFDPPGLTSRLIGRIRRLRSRWRRLAAARGVRRLHPS